jgi:hypothetical protein
VAASAPDPDALSAFAALRSDDGKLTVMVIAKVLTGTTPVTLNFANYIGTGPVQVWQLTASNAIGRLADLALAGNSVATSVPAQSITLFVIAGARPPNHLIGNTSNPTPLSPSIANLAWRDGASQIDVYRDGAFRATVANGGFYSEKLGSNLQPSYIVCNFNTTICSAAVTPAPHRWTRDRNNRVQSPRSGTIGRRLPGSAVAPKR